jgi:dipeptidyl aminopeptidase/acylaminoacyl peptidase
VDHDAPWSSTARMLGAPPSERPEAARQASPLHWVTSDDAPTLLVHGVLDRVVPIEQSRAMHAALGAAGVPSALVPVANAAHDGFGAAADSHVRAFFERHLHGKPVALPSDSIDDWRP